VRFGNFTVKSVNFFGIFATRTLKNCLKS